MRNRSKRFLRDQRGNSVIEVALIAPIMLLIVIGCIELGRYGLVHLKAYNAATSVADMASRGETLTEAQLADLFVAATHIMEPFDMAASGKVIVTGVSATADNAPRVYWQRSGGGGLAASSAVGGPGGTASLPGSLPVRADETVIVTEVFFDYHPAFAHSVVEGGVVSQVAYYRPRIGDLRELE